MRTSKKSLVKLFAVLSFAGIFSINSNAQNTLLGTGAGSSLTSSSNGNVFLGANSGRLTTSGSYNFFAGLNAGYNNTTTSYNSFVGYYSGYVNSTGDRNAFFGAMSGSSNTSGAANTFLGYGAGNLNTTAGFNSFIGSQAGGQNSTGIYNTFLGATTGYSNTTGSYNLFMGAAAGSRNTTGGRNTILGFNAGNFNNTGADNTFTGFQTGTANTTGSRNNFYGDSAGYNNTTGTNNVFIGNSASATGAAMNNVIAIGNGVVANQNNTAILGNSKTLAWGFGANPGSGQAFVVGSYTSATAGTRGNGAYLTNGGVWTNTSDRNKKENITEINGTDILNRICQLNITRWTYKGTNENHIGPMAQDFYKAFGTGIDSTSISTIDPSGVALKAIQELVKQNSELKSALKQMESRLSVIESCSPCAAPARENANLNLDGNTKIRNGNLEQNQPNPVAEATTIRYFLPEGFSQAMLTITSPLGVTVKTIALEGKGAGSLNLSTENLASGKYTYALIINGIQVDSKSLMIVK